MTLLKIFQVLLLAFFYLSFSPLGAKASSLEVGAGGQSTISQAVNSAQAGDSILIHAGTYNEKVDVDKQLTLTSFGDGQVWIDGECNRSYGIQITGSGTVIKNLGVKKTTSQGIVISKATSNVTIENNTIQDFNCKEQGKQGAGGIASLYGGSGIKIINNKITYRVEIAGNQRGNGNGIHFKSNDQNPSGGGHLISGNVITGGYDGIGGGEEGSDRGSFDKDTVIENNTIKNCWDNGIQVEGGNVNIRVANNRIETCGSGIAFAPNRIGPLYIENNIIYGDVNAKGIHGGVSCFKVGKPGSGTAYVTANTCNIPGGSDGGNGFAQSNSGLSPIVSRKNIIQVSRYVMEINGVVAGSSFDEDCMSTSDTDRFIEYAGKKFKDLKSFQDATGQEKNGSQSQNCPGATVVNTTSSITTQPTKIASLASPTTKVVSTVVPTAKPTIFSPTPSPTPSFTPQPTISTATFQTESKSQELDIGFLVKVISYFFMLLNPTFNFLLLF